ncbi:MAG: BtrH N-terminal domain-containing protein [bacterium]
MEQTKMIIDYTHRQSGHCESGTTSNLCKHFGLDLSEPMAFGIGNGLFFSFIPFLKVMYAPMISFRNIPNTVFRRTTKRLGADATVIKKFKTPKESMDALDRNLEKGIPTGMQVGIFHLTFFPPEYRMQYNMHNMVAYGKEGNTYFISDTVLEQPQTITYEDLQRVRWAKGPFAPNGKMYWITGVDKNADIRKAVAEGIAKTVYEMIKIPFPLVGTKGIRVLAKHIRKWPSKLGNAKASFYLGQILRMAEEVGTGGAGFRFIYGAFLKEAGEKFNVPGLLEAADKMGKTANKWREFSYIGARNCKNRSEPVEDYGMLGDMLVEISFMEEEIFKKLNKIKF